MKIPQLFLNNLGKDQKEFQNLLDLTAKVHGENRNPQGKEDVVIWNEDFFHLKNSTLWKEKSNMEKTRILISLGQKILQEAYFIECSGMAYAAKMNLSAQTKEERQFFCFVGEEEAKHLRLVESLANFNTSLEGIPSFALLIGEIIQEATKSSHLLLIQILLEGWGLHYYKTLAKSAMDESVAAAFKAILKDEIRHHSAGVILFSQQKSLSEEAAEEFLGYLERIAFMVKIGPYSACEEIFRNEAKPTLEKLKDFLKETDAESTTAGKMEILAQLLSKSLPDNVLETLKEREILKPLELSEMSEVLFQSMPVIFRQA